MIITAEAVHPLSLLTQRHAPLSFQQTRRTDAHTERPADRIHGGLRAELTAVSGWSEERAGPYSKGEVQPKSEPDCSPPTGPNPSPETS